MRAFIPVPGGFACEIEENERLVLLRVVADVCELLGRPLTDTDDDATSTGADDDDAPAGSEEDAILAALDWETGDAAPPRDPALARLLPSASEDEELAGEMRRLTEPALRTTKVEQLRAVHDVLAASTGLVVVRAGHERAWLSALTDVRLVLASRLGIETDEDAERVYQRAGGRARSEDDELDELDAALSSLYAMLTWWQESLLGAMSRDDDEG